MAMNKVSLNPTRCKRSAFKALANLPLPSKKGCITARW